MEQIVVYNRAGKVKTKLYATSKLCAVKSAEQKRVLLGEDTLQIQTESVEPLDLQIGDYCIMYGSQYTLNAMPEPTKEGEHQYKTDLTFEGIQYKLIDVQYRNKDVLGNNTSGSFTLMADLALAMQVLINCLNSHAKAEGSGEVWMLGDCPNTEYKELTFSNENCLAVLQRLCGEDLFNIEFEIEPLVNKQYKLHLRKAGSVFPAAFTFGKGGGVYELKRKNVDSKNVVTRLYVEGGTRNITTKYRNGAQRLRLDGESYIQQEKPVAAMGIKEGAKQFDDIYPHRKGSVTAAGASIFEFVDSSMFDLNKKDSEGNTEYLQDNTPAKVKFLTGGCAGYELEITKYDHATKTFKVKAYEDSRGWKIPSQDSEAYRIAKGDTYVLLDIIMPHDPYVTDAEKELLEQGTKYYEKNSQPRVEYELTIKSLYLKRKFGADGTVVNLFNVGDYITIRDAEIGVDKAIRIKEFTRNASTDPYDYKVTLSDVVEVSIIERLISDQIETDKIIEINNLTDLAKARANWRTTQELLNMVFDGEGYFDPTHIKPSSIETMMLSVGSRASQFVLQNIVITANSISGNKPNPNLITIQSNGGVLIHYAIEDKDRSWSIQGGSVTLTTDGAYYVYARCAKAGSTGSIIISQSKINVDDGNSAGNYHFVIGVISSIFNGYREVTLTYGATRITGRTINCGRIESIDKKTYFDLDNGEIGGNIRFSSGNGTDRLVSELEGDINGLGESIHGVQDMLNSLKEQVDGTVEYWYGEVVPTDSNYPASEWAHDKKDEHLGDIYTDTKTGIEYRYSIKYDAGMRNPTYYWQEIASSGIGTAIKTANEALAAAGFKSHVYVTASVKSTPPATYKVGDLWLMLDTCKMKYCVKDSNGVSYREADWEDAGYTDDTQALKALSQLSDLAADNKVTPAEKLMLKGELNNIRADFTQTASKATTAGVITTKYEEVFNAMVKYANNLLANMNSTSTVNRDAYNKFFADYYTERANIIDAIAQKKVDDVEIGQGNYIANGAFFESTNGWSWAGIDTNLTAKMKETTKSDLNRVMADYTHLTSLAINNSVLIPTAYTNSYNILTAYVGNLLSDMSSTTKVDTAYYNKVFTNYENNRNSLASTLSTKGVYTLLYLPATKLTGDCELYMDSTMGSVLRMSKSNTTMLSFLITGFSKYNGNIMLPNNKFRAGVKYTLAFWVRANKELELNVGFMESAGQKPVAKYVPFRAGTSWKRIVYTFTANEQQVDDTRLYIRGEETTTYEWLMFTKFVLVEGNKAPEWTGSSQEFLAQVQANKDTLKAITDNYTEINGGLILSTYLKLGAILKNGNWTESAGIKAMMDNANEIAAYYGGTYAEALAGKDDMTVIYHNGKLKTKQADITGIINATSGKIFDVVYGKMRSPFIETDSWSAGYTDNFIPFSATGGWQTSQPLICDKSCSGRRICLCNPAEGSADIQLTDNNCYFYEDGTKKQEISLNREIVELIGYGTKDKFYGWIVLNRRDFLVNGKYGAFHKVMYQGLVNDGVMQKQWSYEGKYCKASKEGNLYRVTLPSSIGASKYTVILTGVSTNGTRMVYACLMGKYDSSFTVYTGDDSSFNDGGFIYQVISIADWV